MYAVSPCRRYSLFTETNFPSNQYVRYPVFIALFTEVSDKGCLNSGIDNAVPANAVNEQAKHNNGFYNLSTV